MNLHRQDLERIDVSVTVFVLGILTLGIYPMVKFYQAASAYEALAGRTSNFKALFWSYLGLSVLGFFTMSFVIGFLLLLGCIVMGILALGEAIDLRDEVMRKHDLKDELTPKATHLALWGIGACLSIILIGVVALIVQGMKFFQDHNTLKERLDALTAGGAQQPQLAAAAVSATGAGHGALAGTPAEQPASGFCSACGEELPGNARFCRRCGAATA